AGSIHTLAPSATSFLTVSGVAATRRSPAACSFSTSTCTAMGCSGLALSAAMLAERGRGAWNACCGRVTTSARTAVASQIAPQGSSTACSNGANTASGANARKASYLRSIASEA
ncbi:hypothetical protein OR61_22080, partial [Xanthomonas vesicatoria]